MIAVNVVRSEEIDRLLQSLIDEGTFGICYWTDAKPVWRPHALSGVTVIDVVAEGKAHVVDAACLRRGLEIALAKIVSGDISPKSTYAIGMFSGGLQYCDPDGLDCLVQLGLFGEIVYG